MISAKQDNNKDWGAYPVTSFTCPECGAEEIASSFLNCCYTCGYIFPFNVEAMLKNRYERENFHFYGRTAVQ
jgi:transcription elongation factor Elf1